jgi:HlyD family secretion protein
MFFLVPAIIIGAGLLGLLVSTMFLPTLRSSLLSPFSTATKRPDLILHKVRSEYLQVSVVERGTLESADNREVVCKVKAGSRGLYSSTIRWVIDDGTLVAKGQLLMELDDSLLQDQYRAQSIIVEKMKSDWINAKEDLIITLKTNQADIVNAESLAKLSELDLDKFIGLRLERDADARGAVLGAMGMLVEQGEFRQKFDDISSRLKLAESDLEAYRDRSAWARRAVGLKYITPSQAKVEESKYEGAKDNVAKLSMEKNILTNFMRMREMTDLQNKLEVARIGLDKSERQANAKRVQSEATERTKYSVYLQELDKLNDIEKQITLTRLYSPQDGMAVYYKEPGGRWGSSNEGVIQQGAQVREGQKLLRIPDLRKMQVNTRVHEAMVSRIRADDRPSTGYFETLRTGMLVSPNAWNRLVMNSELVQDHLRDANRDKEYTLASQGQKAKIRIDAYPDRTFDGHVRTVAAVASQSDWMSSDVKVYQTLVIINESVEGLKPDMSAEVTIQVDPPKEPVLGVPIQSIVGGAEAGPKRRVYVMTAAGPEERIVELGLFNDKMVEVRSGILEDDQVILNPKVLLGDKAKTRDETEAPKTRGAPGGAGKGNDTKKKKA